MVAMTSGVTGEEGGGRKGKTAVGTPRQVESVCAGGGGRPASRQAMGECRSGGGGAGTRRRLAGARPSSVSAGGGTRRGGAGKAPPTWWAGGERGGTGGRRRQPYDPPPTGAVTARAPPSVVDAAAGTHRGGRHSGWPHPMRRRPSTADAPADELGCEKREPKKSARAPAVGIPRMQCWAEGSRVWLSGQALGGSAHAPAIPRQKCGASAGRTEGQRGGATQNEMLFHPDGCMAT